MSVLSLRYLFVSMRIVALLLRGAIPINVSRGRGNRQDAKVAKFDWLRLDLALSRHAGCINVLRRRTGLTVVNGLCADGR